MAVRIVTDSTAQLAPGVIQQYGVRVVPYHIRIGDREYLDKVDLEEDDFYRLVYEEGLPVGASPPAVQEFYQVYQELCQETGQIVSLHASEALSASYDHAAQAANMLLGRCQITVIDSQSISVGLGILVETAARAAGEGRPLDEVVRLVRGLIPQIYVVFFSENLDYLERGGRIGHAQALLGTMLGIKPFLTLEEGEILPMEKVRSRDEALEKLVEFVSEFDAIKQIAIVRGRYSPPEEAQLLIEQLHAVFPDLEIPIVNYGPVLASHIGPSTLGVIVYEQTEFKE